MCTQPGRLCGDAQHGRRPGGSARERCQCHACCARSAAKGHVQGRVHSAAVQCARCAVKQRLPESAAPQGLVTQAYLSALFQCQPVECGTDAPGATGCSCGRASLSDTGLGWAGLFSLRRRANRLGSQQKCPCAPGSSRATTRAWARWTSSRTAGRASRTRASASCTTPARNSATMAS